MKWITDQCIKILCLDNLDYNDTGTNHYCLNIVHEHGMGLRCIHLYLAWQIGRNDKKKENEQIEKALVHI